VRLKRGIPRVLIKPRLISVVSASLLTQQIPSTYEFFTSS
jgi:hypothetical protein